MQKIIKITVLFFFSLAITVFAQVPGIINYQGVLLGPDEQPVPEGEYNLTFNIYNEPGDLLWTETHQQVFISGGMFQVHLGTVNPLELPFNESYFIGIRVNEDPEMQPKMMLTASPYSIRSIVTESVEGIRVSEVPMPNHLLPLDSTGMFPPSVIPPDSGGGGGGIGGSGTPNYIPRFNSQFTLGNSVFYESNGNIGIGTTSPTYKFELAGFDAKIYGLTVGRGSGGIGSNTAFGIEALSSNTTGDINTAIGLQALNNNITGGSNVAIGNQAMYHSTIAQSNIAIGPYTLYHNRAKYRNIAIGYGAMFYANDSQGGTFTDNTAVGFGALYGSGVPANNTGTDNTTVGNFSMGSNTSGSRNCAFGRSALEDNETGEGNTAVGYRSLWKNTTGFNNTALGTLSINNNTTGDFNTGCGTTALVSNTEGKNNTAVGSGSLYANLTADYNTAVGTDALRENTIGENNTAVGAGAGHYTLNTSNSTFIGVGCYANADTLINTAGYGYQTHPTASNQVRVGNSSVSSIGGYVNWTNISDDRYKTNVKEDVKGLDFILQLRPVTYNLNITKLSRDLGEGQSTHDLEGRNLKSRVVYSGFIAQEVERISQELNYNFSGIDAPKNDKDFYGLRYAEFVVPLVKAVQEQQKIIEELTRRIEVLERR